MSLDGQAKLLHRWGLTQSPIEQMWVIAYSANDHLRTVVTVGMGTHIDVQGHMPTLLGAVIAAGSERFMVVHNHPDGPAAPSEGDAAATLEIKVAAEHCGLWFEDHMIVAPGEEPFSFHRAGLLYVEEYGNPEQQAPLTMKS